MERPTQPSRVRAAHLQNLANRISTVFEKDRALLHLSGGDNVRLWDLRDLLGELTVTRSGTDLEIVWSLGILEQVEGVHGPWANLPEATSPWLVPAQGTARFYRVLVSESD